MGSLKTVSDLMYAGCILSWLCARRDVPGWQVAFRQTTGDLHTLHNCQDFLARS